MRQRFKIAEFKNRSSTSSWRVSGIRRSGERVRINFADSDAAKMKQIELEAEFFARQPDAPHIRATKMSESQVQIAELCFPRLARDEDMMDAIELWLRTGKQAAGRRNDVRIDEAFAQFGAWLAGESGLREISQKNLRNRVAKFAAQMGRTFLHSITPEAVEGFLDSRTTSEVSKDNDLRAISRFFSWTMEKPRHWIMANPCAGVKVAGLKAERLANGGPKILSVAECDALLRSAERVANGAAVPWLAVCLFGGLRPDSEAKRLDWSLVNLDDGEIRILSTNKTERPRVVDMDRNLVAWLRAYKGLPFVFPQGVMQRVKLAAGFGGKGKFMADGTPLKPWPADVLRHTAISHKWRQTGSYGLTAAWAGNSEAVIREHYQGRVTSEDAAKFYALMPSGSTP